MLLCCVLESFVSFRCASLAWCDTLCSLLVFAAADNITLGTACGKMYRTSVLTIMDAGDSDIIRAIPDASL